MEAEGLCVGRTGRGKTVRMRELGEEGRFLTCDASRSCRVLLSRAAVSIRLYAAVSFADVSGSTLHLGRWNLRYKVDQLRVEDASTRLIVFDAC